MDSQIFIGLDGPDGQVYQVSLTEYHTYWKHLGYRNFGTAKLLPGFEPKERQPVKRERVTIQQKLGL